MRVQQKNFNLNLNSSSSCFFVVCLFSRSAELSWLFKTAASTSPPLHHLALLLRQPRSQPWVTVLRLTVLVLGVTVHRRRWVERTTIPRPSPPPQRRPPPPHHHPRLRRPLHRSAVHPTMSFWQRARLCGGEASARADGPRMMRSVWQVIDWLVRPCGGSLACFCHE